MKANRLNPAIAITAVLLVGRSVSINAQQQGQENQKQRRGFA
jgi:hypothetical protein